MKKSALIFAASLIAASMSATAIPVSFGTAELVTTRDCIAGVTGCDGLSPIRDRAYGGSPGAATSSASVAVAGYGAASGSVSLSGTIGAPILTASANSEAGKRTNTNSVALQRYTYTGLVPTTRTFGGTLTYSQTVTGPYPIGVGDGVNANIAIFALPDSAIEAGTTPESNFDALFNVSSLPGYEDLAFANYRDAASTTDGTGTFEATATLDPGDTVWVWVLLQTPAANGATIDASHTLITGWNNPANLVPAVSVPEPGTAALLGLGFAAVLASCRRARRFAVPA